MRSGRLGRGIAFGALEFANNTQFFDGLHTFLPALWSRSSATHGCVLHVPRVVAYVEEDVDEALADAQDLLDKARDVTLVRSAVYQ
jgi:hypothetical protein